MRHFYINICVFKILVTAWHITPVGFPAMERHFDRSLKTLHPFNTLAAVIILKRIDFVTSPFFKRLSFCLMNYVVCIFQNKAHSWQVHNTLQDGSDCLQISAGTDVSTSDRIELSVHDEVSRVISNLQLLFTSGVEAQCFYKKNLRCHIVLLSEWLQ